MIRTSLRKYLVALVAASALFAPIVSHALEPAMPYEIPLSDREKAALRENAEMGDAMAQEKMGELYFRWAGVKPDYIEAARWFGMSAAQGNGQADGYLKRITTFTAEHRRLQALAETGDAKAEYDFAVHTPHGATGLTGDRPAATWLRLSAEQGYDDAEDYLGHLYYLAYIDHDWKPSTPDVDFEGDSAVTDLTGAIQWFEKAAEAGNSSAQGIVGQLYGISGPTQDLNKLRYWLEKSVSQAAEPNIYLETLCKLDFDGGLHEHAWNYDSYLARINFTGKPGYGKAFACYRRLSDQFGPLMYHYQMGYMLLYGRGTRRDVVKGLAELIAASQSPFHAVEAKYELAQIYWQGRIAPGNIVKADALLTEAIAAWAPNALPPPHRIPALLPEMPHPFMEYSDVYSFEAEEKQAHIKAATAWVSQLRLIEKQMTLDQKSRAAALAAAEQGSY